MVFVKHTQWLHTQQKESIKSERNSYTWELESPKMRFSNSLEDGYSHCAKNIIMKLCMKSVGMYENSQKPKDMYILNQFECITIEP